MSYSDDWNQVIHTEEEFEKQLINRLQEDFSVTPQHASDNQIYKALSTIMVRYMKKKRKRFMNQTHMNGNKQVYYLSMEFLMGRSLKTTLYNLEAVDVVKNVLKKYDISLSKVYEYEPDAGLGNGGLGRLAACYLDAAATQGYAAMGYSICYEYGIFKQKMEEGWQTELPDNWLPGGEVWLMPKADRAVEIHFDGSLEETWEDGYHHIRHKNYTSVVAVPYDLYVSGYNTPGVSVLRLWQAKIPAFDMMKFNQGDYAQAMGQNTIAQAISKVLYPNDNHLEGKSLRLRQQYFLCAASVGDIVNHHMSVYGTLENLHERVAIHINDTHPTLAIPELMRVLMDDCGYGWDQSWYIVQNTFAYTNHTVMAEAMEKWDIDLIKQIIPRVYQIICEINRRYCEDLQNKTGDTGKVSRMSILKDGRIHMAKLCVSAAHNVNGVSALHSDILKSTVFMDEYSEMPNKFTNVTNGIAYRRWLLQSNPSLTDLLRETIGDGFMKNGAELCKLREYADNTEVLERLAAVKRENKEAFAKYVHTQTGISLNCDSIFDVQVKRLHEYKRQHLNALNILSEYAMLKENPDMDFQPKTYIFAAKAAPGYYLAKQIIKLIWSISEELRGNKRINEKLAVYFLEDYRVTLSEILMPAAEISEQISQAGTEASGTGNMKLMLNGAITLGTMDGANVEISEQVGSENILTFGMTSKAVAALQMSGYRPDEYYRNNGAVQKAIDMLYQGINGSTFEEIAKSLREKDQYMVLADFKSYQAAQARASTYYREKQMWNRMSLYNIAGAGIFSADRAIAQYAKEIWRIGQVSSL